MTRLAVMIEASLPLPEDPPVRWGPYVEPTNRRLAKAMGHQFNDRLECAHCGIAWDEHQEEPQRCEP